MKGLVILLRILTFAFYIFGGVVLFFVGAALGAGGYLSIYVGKLILGLVLMSIGAALTAIAKSISKKP